MKKDNKKWYYFIILGGFLIKFAQVFFMKISKKSAIEENFKKFISEEKKEVNELKDGKEGFKKYCHDSCSLVVDYFIPHECNGYKPKILRKKSLAIILISAIALKIFVTGYIFFIFPNFAKMQSEMANEIFKLTNEVRIKNGLQPLKINAALSSSAQAKAEDMGLKNYFAHYGPDGKKPWDWIDRTKYQYIFVGENLGMNFSTAKTVQDALMDSPSHRHNILNDKYEDMGVAVFGCVIDGQKTNVLVELFGKEKTSTQIAKKPAISAPAATATPKIEVQNKPQTNSTGIKPAVEGAEHETAKNDEVEKIVTTQEPSESLLNQQITADDTIDDESLGNLENQIKFVAPIKDAKLSLAGSLMNASKIIYIVILTFLIISLLINVLVHVSVQHKAVILQTLAVILIIAGLTVAQIIGSISNLTVIA